MYCRFCGYEITEEDIYCPNCGKRCISPISDEKPKKRSKTVILVLLAVVLVIAAGVLGVLFVPSLFTVENATVSITSSPAGASVYVGDTYMGEAPLTISILPDIQTDIHIGLDKYITWTESVTLAPGEHSTFHVTLELAPAPVVSDTEETFERVYEWKYNGYTFSAPLSLSKEKYAHYQKLGHSNLNLVKYAADSYNRRVVSEIAGGIKAQAESLEFTNYETMMLAASFVQSLPYTTDKETTGQGEYVRYPIETLVDGGGDCEDKSILMGALLKELGCDVVILEFRDHAAVGVKADRDDAYGSYAKYGGVKYFYLETTKEGWELGEIPSEYDLNRIDKISKVT